MLKMIHRDSESHKISNKHANSKVAQELQRVNLNTCEDDTSANGNNEDLDSAEMANKFAHLLKRMENMRFDNIQLRREKRELNCKINELEKTKRDFENLECSINGLISNLEDVKRFIPIDKRDKLTLQSQTEIFPIENLVIC
jgi:hypothetical protein